MCFEIIEIENMLYTIRPKSNKHDPDRSLPESISRDLGFYENAVVVDARFENIEDRLKEYAV